MNIMSNELVSSKAEQFKKWVSERMSHPFYVKMGVEAVKELEEQNEQLRKESARLTEIAAQKASRADELFEALESCRDSLSQANMYVGFDFGDEIKKADILLDKIKSGD